MLVFSFVQRSSYGAYCYSSCVLCYSFLKPSTKAILVKGQTLRKNKTCKWIKKIRLTTEKQKKINENKQTQLDEQVTLNRELRIIAKIFILFGFT